MLLNLKETHTGQTLLPGRARNRNSVWRMCGSLVAPYSAIPQDYLSDTPPLRTMRFFVSQHSQLGAIPPPPFLRVSALESMRSGGAIPPPQKGYLSDTCAIPYDQRVLNVGAQTWELEICRKAAGKRHFPATQLLQCCSAVFRLLQRSFWSK